MQKSKTLYFQDYPTSEGHKTGLTISFPKNKSFLYDAVKHLSSYRIRELIGFDSYIALEKAALNADTSITMFTRTLLEKSFQNSPSADEPKNFGTLQATFQGGKGSPLHDWYPYLEGYSPEFVQTIIDKYAPNARTVLDPFCGSGTTAIVSAMSGRLGLYSEVNPICRFIINAKTKALSYSPEVRAKLSTSLYEIRNDLPSLLKKLKPDSKLEESFYSCFGNRPFFNEKSFDLILKVRRFIDIKAKDDDKLADLITVAMLRSLVPGSLLVRRGDLRFKTEQELKKNNPSLESVFLESLSLIASDLQDTPQLKCNTKLVCNNARDIGESGVTEDIDLIVTSPPYLNGTNYFRNTKIELWFLRELKNKADLRQFRDEAITSGINDVTVGKYNLGNGWALPPLLQETLNELSENAYDQRIPKMVYSYFKEMADVIAALKQVSNQNTTVAIDLGDSCYQDVWVQTDKILQCLMEQEGFELSDYLTLRERQSRGGRKLTQSLQVFRRKKQAEDRPSSLTLEHWQTFKTELPHQKGDMAKRNWGHPWHSLCSYQGKLKPSIGYSLVQSVLSTKGCRVLDPFSGVGTIPFEARLNGHFAYGFDISPAATPISKAKLEEVEIKKVKATFQNLSEWVHTHKTDAFDKGELEKIRFNGPLPNYFHPDTLAEIVAARKFFAAFPPEDGSSALVLACLLHILHGNRPYALSRRSHPITPFSPTGPIEYRGLLNRLGKKLEKSLLVIPKDVPTGKMFYQDATLEWPEEVNNLDAIITSPPFFDSTRFHMANWMRLWFSGWDLDSFAEKPKHFVDERQKKNFAVYDPIFAQAAERMKTGAVFAIHLGKSAKCDMAQELLKVGNRHLKLIDEFTESVEHCESHGIRVKGSVTHHQYLLFQKE